MADKRVSIQIDGKVIVDDSDLKRVRRDLDTIGNGRRVDPDATPPGSSPATPPTDPQQGGMFTPGTYTPPDPNGPGGGGNMAEEQRDRQRARDALDKVDGSAQGYIDHMRQEAERAAQRRDEREREEAQRRRQLDTATQPQAGSDVQRGMDMSLHADRGMKALDAGDLTGASRALVNSMRENEPGGLVGKLRSGLLEARRAAHEEEHGVPDANPGGLTWQYAQTQANRSILGIRRGMASASTDRDYEKLLQRADGARVYTAEAGSDDLKEQLEELVETLTRNREALAENTKAELAVRRGDGGEEDGVIDVVGRALDRDGGERIGGMITRALGGGRAGQAVGGMVGGMIGSGALMTLGIAGAAVGALGFAANAARATNAPAREEVSAFADLGRQYNVNDDLIRSFREGGGRTAERFRLLGFSATEAAGVAARYDRPLGGPAGMLDGTESILGFSRATGLEANQVAAGARALSLGTGNGPEESLRILRIAISEGFENGVSSSDTMQALVEFSRRSAASGQAISEQGLAAQALYLDNLNGLGSDSLKGSMGATAAARMQAGLTDGQDEGMNYVLDMAIMRAVESGTLNLADTGFEGNELHGLERIMRNDPLYAASLIRGNAANSPKVMDLIAGSADSVFGGNAALAAQFLESTGLSEQQVTGLNAFQNPFTTGAFGQLDRPHMGRTEDFRDPGNVPSDVQRGNELAMQNDALGIARDDREFAKSMASLNLTGDFESAFVNITGGMVNIINRGSGGLPDGTTDPTDPAYRDRMKQLQDGSLSGRVDTYASEHSAAGLQARAAAEAGPGFDQGRLDPYRQGHGFEGATFGAQGLDAAGGTAGSIARGTVPAATAITNRQGTNPGGHNRADGHHGLDIDGQSGDAVTALASGIVISAGDTGDTGLGKHVIIQDANGVQHVYGHLQAIAAAAQRAGSEVFAGQEIGLIGSTGTSTGSHLHYQTKDAAGNNIDPEAYYRLGAEEGGLGYAAGGFTGAGHRNEVAGRVHRGEYVWSQEATDRYLPALQALQAGSGTPAGGGVLRIQHEHTGGIRVDGVSAETAAQLQDLYRHADRAAAELVSRDPRIGSPLQRGGVR